VKRGERIQAVIDSQKLYVNKFSLFYANNFSMETNLNENSNFENQK
jgi:hypothetical protein